MENSRISRKTAANRRNAKRSTGPRDTSSTRYNAIRHGLVAEGVTELDDTEDFRTIVDEVDTQFQPIGVIERTLTRQIALCLVRLRRAAMLEAEYITGRLNPPEWNFAKRRPKSATSRES